MSQSPDRNDAGNEKLRVLVVDDEPTLRLGFAYALSNRTTIVETAASGRHALEKMAESGFDLMILDLRMPELDGIGVIEAVRSEGNRIPIVLCSAALQPNSALRAIRHGVIDFLLKPVRPVDLRQVIEFVMRPQRQPQALAMQAARQGRMERAIEIFETVVDPTRQMACWLCVLRAIRDATANEDACQLEEAVRSNLARLAFNAPPFP